MPRKRRINCSVATNVPIYGTYIRYSHRETHREDSGTFYDRTDASDYHSAIEIII